MRLLITTQAVDLDDPVLGFFHSWIAALATGFEQVHVICLREGRHALPSNVSVHSLGKEARTANSEQRTANRFLYSIRFLRLIWQLRREYDAVFVHMNPEYAVLGGILWRAWGKRIVLWRNHKMYSSIMALGVALSHIVCYTSPDAYVSRYATSSKMPVGIDTDTFRPGSSERGTILFLGRLDAVKNPDVFLEAMARLPGHGREVRASVYGDASSGREQYAADLKERYKGLTNVAFHAGISHDATPAIYRAHDIYVNLTPSGSFDKTIGEAMASGCVAIVANDAVKEALLPGLLVPADDPVRIAGAIEKALSLSPGERAALVQRQRDYIVREHSLALLVERLIGILRA